MDRDKIIIRTSVVGIVTNLLLAGFKAFVGLLAGSIAIIMDAVNNLSDVLSSVITIAGTKLSARPADAKHPFGYGRIEYLTAIVIAIIVLIAGASSLIESIKKIFYPTEPTYTIATLIIIVVAILVKVILGLYVKRKGQQLKSDALIASGADALFDSIITLATLVSAGIMLIWQVNVDGIFGTLISLVIIKAGIEMLGSPISQLLGKGVPREIYETLRSNVLDYPEVHGVFDIILNYYGPNVIIGSLHINVLDTMNSRDIHRLTRTITLDILNKNGIIVTIGIYAINTHGEQAEIQKKVMSAVSGMEKVESLHAFYYYEDKKLVTLDVVPNSYVHDDNAFREMIQKELKALYPNFEFDILIDHNYLEKEDK